MKTREDILAEQAAQDSGGLSQFLAGLGASFASRDPSAVIGGMKAADDERKRRALQQYDQDQQLTRQTTLDNLAAEDRTRRNTREDTLNQRADDDYTKKTALDTAEADPMSPQSQMAQELAVKMGMDAEKAKGLSASKFKSFSPALEKMYQITEKAKSDKMAADERNSTREESAAERAERAAERQSRDTRDYADRQEREGTKKEEKNYSLATPYGPANTPDDAKQLKEAHESKKNFDGKIQEMIDLRKKYGGELLNREAVARGKQLSKDLLLEYKNMAKLGVLSKSDEDIINAIIPEDPLAFQAASLVGQDPILHKLQSFKSDSDKDFANRVKTRTRGGTMPSAPGSSGGTVRVQAPDGSIRMIPADQVRNAVAAGGKVVDG